MVTLAVGLVAALALVLLLSSAPSLAAPLEAQSAVPGSDPGWHDDFDSPSLDPRWFWVREDPSHWSLGANPGYLRITTQAGGVYSDTNDQKNILLTNAPVFDHYQITTRATISPTENFQYAALMVHQDDDNYVQLNRAYANGPSVNFDIEISGQPTSYRLDVSAETVYLRIAVIDGIYAGYYSLDGDIWTLVGQGGANLHNPKIGLTAANNLVGVTEIAADFDFFELKRYPVNASVSDDFNAFALDSRWFWVREDATHWSLGANPGYLRITTQAGGVYSDTNDQKNILLTNAPHSDCYQVSTKVTISPTENYQYAAVQVYQDDDNYVQLNRAYADGHTLNFDIEIDGQPTNQQVALSAETVHLRIAASGDTYRGYYSLDGSIWTLVGEGEASLHNPKTGLAAANNMAGAAEINADFDSFTMVSCPGENTETDPFDPGALDSRWSWVNEDPPKWSLSANPGYMRMITDDASVSDSHKLLQLAPMGNYELRTRMLFTPTHNFQIAGLLLYQDGDNYLLLGRGFL